MYSIYNLHYEKFADGTVKCIEDEIPFEVPDGWAWCRLVSLSIKIGAGSTPTGGASVYSATGIKFIRSQNVYNNGLFLEDVAFISEEINKKKSGSIVHPKDILLNITGGSIGRCALVPDDFDIANVNQHVMIIRLAEISLRNFIHSVLTSLYIQEQILSRQVGSGRGGLSAETLSMFLFPIPPINEQLRINESLANCFSHVLTINTESDGVSELIAKTKSKILDLAIRGKLVPQDPNDEPASALLERIRAEKKELIKQGKIKRDKKESIIFRGDDNSYYEKQDNEYVCIDGDIPYCVPNGWEWCTLGICCQKTIKRGKSPKYSTEGNTLVFAQKCNTKHNGIDLSLALKLEKTMLTKYSDEEFMIDEDIVINSTGTGTLGRVGIYKDSDNYNHAQIVPDSQVTVIRTHRLISSEYVYAFLKYNQPLLEKMGEGSTNQKELKPISLINLRIPIPPLEEQKRIVDKVAMLLNCINSIEVNLV